MVLYTKLQDTSGFCSTLFLVVGTPNQFRWLYGIIEAIIILNLLDAVLTMFWVHTGVAQEANPLLQPIVHKHALLFITVKIALGSLGTWLLWQYRHRALAVIGTFVVFIAYYAVFLHHLRFASFLERLV